MRRVEFFARDFALTVPFVIAGYRYDAIETVQVRIHEGTAEGRQVLGRGEGVGVDYHGESAATMLAQLAAVRPALEAGADRAALLALLPPGGARCAADGALLDLEAQLSGVPVAQRLELTSATESAITIGLCALGVLRTAAAQLAPTTRTLKIKVDGHDPLQRIAAAHEAAPAARLIVDPNQSWTPAQLKTWAPALSALGVVLLEQPIPVGSEAELDGWQAPIPLAADELVHEIADLDKARGRFQIINIKLDKSGGLTAALALADRAEAAGFALMAGCMVGSSLSMAPALLLASRCVFVDLDGPALQSEDWPGGLVYHGGQITPAMPGFWG